MTLAQQLTEIYLNEETYLKEKLPREEALRYYEEALAGGRIISVTDGPILVGYLEFSIQHGVCFIVDLFIRPEYRRGQTYKMIKRRLFEVCKGIKIFTGERNKNGHRYPEFQIRRSHGE